MGLTIKMIACFLIFMFLKSRRDSKCGNRYPYKRSNHENIESGHREENQQVSNSDETRVHDLFTRKKSVIGSYRSYLPSWQGLE